MNRRLIIRLLVIFMTSWSLLAVPNSASAHDSEAHIELSITQAQPGMVVEEHGSGFEPSATTTIMLMNVITDQSQILGRTMADDHEDPTQVISLPAVLTDDADEVRMADNHHVATAAQNIVTDSSDDDEGGQRGEHEPLLTPIPTQAASAEYSTAAPTASTTTSLPTSEVEPPIPISLLFPSALAIVILVASIAVILRRFR